VGVADARDVVVGVEVSASVDVDDPGPLAVGHVQRLAVAEILDAGAECFAAAFDQIGTFTRAV
jgi:hypothetical protein